MTENYLHLVTKLVCSQMSTKVKTPLKDISIKNLGNGNELYLIDLEVLSSGIIASIDGQLVKICEGNSGRTVQLVKDRIKKYLDKKRGSDLETGSIAELCSTTTLIC